MPLESDLIATGLSINGAPLPAGASPAPVTRKLEFSPNPLALYEGTLSLPLSLPDTGEKPTEIHLALQACSTEVCLQPEDVMFYRW